MTDKDRNYVGFRPRTTLFVMPGLIGHPESLLFPSSQEQRHSIPAFAGMTDRETLDSR